jgi:hypothetical protein
VQVDVVDGIVDATAERIESERRLTNALGEEQGGGVEALAPLPQDCLAAGKIRRSARVGGKRSRSRAKGEGRAGRHGFPMFDEAGPFPQPWRIVRSR